MKLCKTHFNKQRGFFTLKKVLRKLLLRMTDILFVGNSILNVSLDLLKKFWKTSLKVA